MIILIKTYDNDFTEEIKEALDYILTKDCCLNNKSNIVISSKSLMEAVSNIIIAKRKVEKETWFTIFPNSTVEYNDDTVKEICSNASVITDPTDIMNELLSMSIQSSKERLNDILSTSENTTYILHNSENIYGALSYLCWDNSETILIRTGNYKSIIL